MNYDETLDDLEGEVASLRLESRAVLFLCIGDALYPVYQRFRLAHNWVDHGVVEKAIRYMRGALTGASRCDSVTLEEFGRNIPHVDDFDDIDVHSVLECFGCYTAALQIVLGTDAHPSAIECALNPVQYHLLSDKFNIIAPGGSADDKEKMNWLYSTDRMNAAVLAVRGAIEIVRHVDRVDESILDTIRRELRAVVM